MARDDAPKSTVAVAVLGLVGLLVSTGLTRWVSCAAVLAAAPAIVGRWAQHPAWQQRRGRLPLAIVAVACAWLLSELILGRPPASRDHALHLFEINLLVTEFLPRGSVSGWTDSFNNGLPFGEAYPWFGHLWSAGAHLLSGGLVPLRTSYAWGLLAIWVLATWGVWLVAAEAAREVGGSERGRSVAGWAGCVGALSWLLDPGGSRQGGWAYLMFHGVWPQLLSATLWVLALPLVWRALNRPSPRRIALAALVLGGSVLAHPFGVLTLVCSAALWLVVLVCTPRARSLPAGRLVWWVIMHGAAAILGFGWLASFLAGADSLGRSPVPWLPLGTLATDTLSGEWLSGHAAWTGPLAVVGLVLALRRGGVIAWMTAGLGLGMLVLGSQEAITVLKLDLLAAAFKNLQFPRYSIAIKPLLFAMTGVGAAVCGDALLRWWRPRPAHSLPQRFVLALVVAPLATALLSDPGRLVTRPVGGIETLRNSGQAPHELALREALAAEQATLKGARLRVAYFRRGMGGGMYPIMSVAAVGGALVLDGHVATINFEHRIKRRNTAGLVALGVTHVITDRPAKLDADRKIEEALQKVGTYGPYTLSRLAPGERGVHELVDAPGPASIRVLAHRPGHWVLEAEGVTKATPVRLPFAPHPKWEATLDGQPLPISAAARWGGTATAAQVLVPHDGRVTLHYTDSTLERRARWLALVVAALCVVGLTRARPMTLPVWNWSRSPGRRRAREIAVLVFGVGAILFVHRRQSAQLATTWDAVATTTRGAPRQPLRFVRDLVIEDGLEITRSPDRVCVGILGKNSLEGCSETEHRPRPSFLYRNPYLYRCLRFTVPARGLVEVAAPALAAETSILGTLVRVGRKGKGTRLEFRTQTRWRPMGNRSRAIFVPGGADAGVQLLQIRNRSKRNEPVCLALAVFQP